MRSFKNRIAKLEKKAHIDEPICETWVDEGDGVLRGPSGQTMTHAEFDAAFPDAEEITLNIFDKQLEK